jgi:hypothetical protein
MGLSAWASSYSVRCIDCGQIDEVPAARLAVALNEAQRLGWRRAGNGLLSDSMRCPRCLTERRDRAVRRREVARERACPPVPGRRGPRPSTVRANRDRRRVQAAAWWEDYCETGNMSVTADGEAVTRERVRQVLTEFYGSGLIRLARQRVQARNRLRAYVESDRAVGSVVTECYVCGGTTRTPAFHGPVAFPLCPDHQSIRGALMTMLDPVRHDKHRELVERYHGRVRGAVAGANLGKRWLVKGSQMERLCTEAYEKGWPLFARLPASVQEQVERGGHTRRSALAAGLPPGERPCSREGCENMAVGDRTTCSAECRSALASERMALTNRLRGATVGPRRLAMIEEARAAGIEVTPGDG